MTHRFLGAALDEHGRLAVDRTCLRCGYNLRGLDPAGVCPECALPLRNSLRENSLRCADRGWLRTMRRGWWLVMVSFGAIVVTTYTVAIGALLGFNLDLGTSSGDYFGGVLDVCGVVALSACGVGAVTGLIGLILATTPEPGEGANPSKGRARRWTRRLTWMFAGVGGTTALLCGATFLPSAMRAAYMPIAIVADVVVGFALAISACLLMSSLIRRSDVRGVELAHLAVGAIVAVAVSAAFWWAANSLSWNTQLSGLIIMGAVLLLGVGPITPVLILVLVGRTHRAVSNALRDNIAGPWRMLRARR